MASRPASYQQPYRDRRALVLGASGFIGRWVARVLTESGARLSVVVRSRRDAAPVLAAWGIAADVIEADLTNRGEVAEACRIAAPSITFNLAGYGVDRSEQDEDAAYAINARLVETLATALAEQPEADPTWSGRQLVHVGSGAEYGDVVGIVEEDRDATPTTVYGRSKRLGTDSVARACQTSALRAVSARLFMVYGPGEHEGRLLPDLIRGSREHRDLALSSGTQRRDFTYVEDVAEGLLRLGLSQGLSGAAVNLASGRLIAVRDAVLTAAEELGIDPQRLRFGALPPGREAMGQVAGISLARLRALTGWSPPTSLRDGIRRTLAHRDLDGRP